MIRKKILGWKPIALAAVLLLTVGASLLLPAKSVLAAGTTYNWNDKTHIAVTIIGGGTTPTAVNYTFTGSTDSSGKGSYSVDVGGCTAKLTVTYSSSDKAYHALGSGGGDNSVSGDCGLLLPDGKINGDKGPDAPSSGGGTTKDSGVGDDATLTCGGGKLNWIICPVITLIQGASEQFDSFITNTMNVDVKGIFDTTGGGKTQTAYYTAWNSFRLLGTTLLVIGGLVMVISQAFGFEFLGAYTTRKVLPRLLLAIVGISLSWPLMAFVVGFFDTLGFDIRNLIYAPFSHLGGTINVEVGILSSLAPLAIWAAQGWASLTLVGTAFLAAFVGFLILVVRQIAIIVLIILAPFAIACYVLPNTQKVWKLWSDNFLGLMLMFPIVSAFIATGHVFAAVSLAKNGQNAGSDISQVVGIVAYFAPYFLLPVAARLATGIIGTLAGVVNDRHRGAFDLMKNARGGAQKRRFKSAGNRAKTGAIFKRAGEGTRRDRLNTAIQSATLLREGGAMLGTTKASRNRIAAGRARVNEQMIDHMLEDKDYVAKGDDTWNHNAYEAKDTGDFREKMLATGRYQKEKDGSLTPLGKKNLDMDVQRYRTMAQRYGTEAFKQAAWVQTNAGGTELSMTPEKLAESWKDAAELAGGDNMALAGLVAKGRSVSMAAGRADVGGASFGTTYTVAKAFMDNGGKVAPTELMKQQSEALATGVKNSQSAGVLSHASMKDTVLKNLTPYMKKDLDTARSSLQVATQAGDAIGTQIARDRLDGELAFVANFQDQMAGSSKGKAAIFSDNILMKKSGVATAPDAPEATYQQLMDSRRSAPAFRARRRELTAAEDEYRGSRGAAGPGGPSTTPPTTPPVL